MRNLSNCEINLLNSYSKMFKSDRHEITQKSVIKKYRNKRKTYWCAPRKVKSINVIGNVDNSSVQDKKPKKKHRKKKRKNKKILRRIDVLAQPKSLKHYVEHKNHSSNVSGFTRRHKITKSISSHQKNSISPRKTLKIRKFKGAYESPKNLLINSALKDCPPIVLPKKIGVRLFSLVRKRLRQLTNSKSV